MDRGIIWKEKGYEHRGYKLGQKVIYDGREATVIAFDEFDQWDFIGITIESNALFDHKTNGLINSYSATSALKSYEYSDYEWVSTNLILPKELEPYIEPVEEATYAWVEEYHFTPEPNERTINYSREYYDSWRRIRLAHYMSIKQRYAMCDSLDSIEQDTMDEFSWTDECVSRNVLLKLGVEDNDDTFSIVCIGLVEWKEFDEVFEELKEKGWVM